MPFILRSPDLTQSAARNEPKASANSRFQQKPARRYASLASSPCRGGIRTATVIRHVNLDDRCGTIGGALDAALSDWRSRPPSPSLPHCSGYLLRRERRRSMRSVHRSASIAHTCRRRRCAVGSCLPIVQR
jgi:hypothetical protein